MGREVSSFAFLDSTYGFAWEINSLDLESKSSVHCALVWIDIHTHTHIYIYAGTAPIGVSSSLRIIPAR